MPSNNISIKKSYYKHYKDTKHRTCTRTLSNSNWKLLFFCFIVRALVFLENTTIKIPITDDTLFGQPQILNRNRNTKTPTKDDDHDHDHATTGRTENSSEYSNNRKKQHIPSRGSSSSFSVVPRPLKKKSTTKKQAWRYDEAAPEIQYAKTHFLSSIPKEHRVTFDNFDFDFDFNSKFDAESNSLNSSSSSSSSSNFTFFQAFDDYASHRHNIFPHKVHLAEMNPTIAKLPDRYLTDPKWLQAFGSNSGGRGGSSNDNTGRGWGSRSEGVGIPLYIATYRVTEYHDCFQSSHSLAIKFGGDYPNWLVKKRHQKLNYLGLALLDENLDIVTDITVTLEGIQSSNRRGKEGIFIKKYEDYRVFNLRGGNNSWNGNGDGDANNCI